LKFDELFWTLFAEWSKEMTYLLDGFSAVFLILGWWVAVSSYPQLPESIPIHFGLSGEPDGWGGRWTIFLMPVIATIIFALDYFVLGRLVGTPKMPSTMTLPLHLMMLELTVLFTYITWRISEVAFGRAEGIGVWFLPVILLGILGTSAWMLVAAKG